MISDQLIIGCAVIATCCLGFRQILREKSRISHECMLAVEYLEHLKMYIQSQGKDHGAYGWLVHRSNKMQKQLGRSGIYASYRPPYANFQYSNYPIILNMLPDLRNALNDAVLLNNLAHQYSMALQDTLVRHLGSLHDLDEVNDTALHNPVIWLREGVRVITAFPLSLLGWLGAMSETTIAHITSSRIFKAISAFAALVGFVSAVIGVVLGWEQFAQLVGSMCRNVF